MGTGVGPRVQTFRGGVPSCPAARGGASIFGRLSQAPRGVQWPPVPNCFYRKPNPRVNPGRARIGHMSDPTNPDLPESVQDYAVSANGGGDADPLGGGELACAEMDPSYTRDLVESRMPQRSWAQLERQTGLDNIPRRLLQAQRQRYIPLDVVAAVVRATDLSVAELVVAMFADAGYRDLLPFDMTPDLVRVLGDLADATPEEQALIRAWLAWLRSARPS